MIERLSKPKDLSPAIDAQEIKSLPGLKKEIFIRAITFQSRVPFAERSISDLIEVAENSAHTVASLNELAEAITSRLKETNIRAYIPVQTFDKGMLYINLTDAK